jgi:hypothetical protein
MTEEKTAFSVCILKSPSHETAVPRNPSTTEKRPADRAKMQRTRGEGSEKIIAAEEIGEPDGHQGQGNVLRHVGLSVDPTLSEGILHNMAESKSKARSDESPNNHLIYGRRNKG